MLAITGMTYHDLIGTSYLQDVNNDYLFDDVARLQPADHGAGARRRTSSTTPAAPRSRTAASRTSRFPIDYQAHAADDGEPLQAQRPRPHPARSGRPARAAAAGPRAGRRVLAGGKKVAILAGAGARGAGAELRQLAEKLGAPIIKALLGKDCVPDDSPYITGGIGVVGTRPSQEAFEECDALLIVGSLVPLHRVPAAARAGGVRADRRSARAHRPAVPRRRRPGRRRPRHAARSCCRCCSATRTAVSSTGCRTAIARLVGADGGARHQRRTCR